MLFVLARITWHALLSTGVDGVPARAHRLAVTLPCECVLVHHEVVVRTHGTNLVAAGQHVREELVLFAVIQFTGARQSREHSLHLWVQDVLQVRHWIVGVLIF